jgi:hypothetical protein
MRILKFKDFVLELNESAKLSRWVELQKAAFETYKPNARWISPKTGEILRAEIDSSNPEEDITNFLSFCGINKSDFTISSGNYSGKFDSWEIKFKTKQDFFGKTLDAGSSFGIVNSIDTSKGVKQVIGDKDLTPDKLGLAGDYPKQSIIIDKSKTAIKQSINDITYQNFCLALVDSVSSYKPVFTTVDDVEGVNQDFSISYDFSEYLAKIDPKSIKTIEKDFGEILGGIFMFNLIKETGTGLTFPTASNLELVDFFFNGLAVSSKAGKGAKASASGYINAINRSMKIANWVPTSEENLVIDKLLKPLSDVAKERNNDKFLKRSRSSSTFSNSVNLFNLHLNEGNTGWHYFLSESGLNGNSINRDDIVQSFIDFKTKNSLHKFLSTFTKLTNLNTSDRGKSAALLIPFMNSKNEKQAHDALDKILSAENYDLLIGLILYGCSKQLQTVVNTNYSHVLTSIINKSLSVKQLYLDTKINKNLILFSMRAMENSNFELGTLNGIESWGIKSITISMVK